MIDDWVSLLCSILVSISVGEVCTPCFLHVPRHSVLVSRGTKISHNGLPQWRESIRPI